MPRVVGYIFLFKREKKKQKRKFRSVYIFLKKPYLTYGYYVINNIVFFSSTKMTANDLV